ncbi:hypothetical protein JCM1393_28610 [Clostridium carnis]
MFCFIDYRTTFEEKYNLRKLGFSCIEIPKSKFVYPAIDGHVDIQLNILNKNSKKVIIHRDMPKNFKEILVKNKISFIETSNSLSSKYPNDIIINALILDNYFIHNLKFTDNSLLKTQNLKKIINVNQGYTKCSCLPVNENAIITNDKGIFSKLILEGFDVLYLPPGDILLPTLSYGFIGGVGGLINSNTMAFFGNLDDYIYGEEVKKFLKKYDVKPVYLKKGKLYDRGSLLVL